MINKEYFKNKRITVIGLGRSGFACAQLLHNLGSDVSVTDQNNNEQVSGYAGELNGSIKVELGRHTLDFIRGRDLIVTSPGVDDNSPALIWARKFGIPVISEIECAWMVCPASVVAITGTNGKTTTTTLIGRLLEASGRKAFVLGNIGIPFSSKVQEMQSRDFVSLEVSSFQLETIGSFKPKIAVIINFTTDHLDRYPDMSAYLSAKSRIFMNQDETDYLVLNYDDSIVRGLSGKTKAKVVYFSRKLHENPNYAVVTAVASILNISRDVCEEVFSSFKGLPHRLEFVTSFRDREFINDSKATNLDAAVFALAHINKPIILIAGGRDKGSDYSTICDLVCSKARSLILIGEAKEKIRQAFQSKLPIKIASDLKEAVSFAYQESLPGDCILLSPMCSSFDMFKNYEERGDVFKKIVHGILSKI